MFFHEQCSQNLILNRTCFVHPFLSAVEAFVPKKIIHLDQCILNIKEMMLKVHAFVIMIVNNPI